MMVGMRSMSLEIGVMFVGDLGYGNNMYMGQGFGFVQGVVGLGDESVYQYIKDMFQVEIDVQCCVVCFYII